MAGAIISALLLWGIYVQVQQQLHNIDKGVWLQTGPTYFLWLCVLLLPVNLALEGLKWHILSDSAQPISYRGAFASCLAGIAFSVITPNRIGEYPGRILYLKRKNTFRLISVSILGMIAQLFTFFIFGLIGLIYYNIAYPGPIERLVLLACLLATTIIGIVYWRFEKWLPLLKKYKWARRYNIYAQLLNRFSGKELFNIIFISLARFAVFTAQYLFILRWMNVEMPLAGGFCLAGLFFWVMAVIPSIALTELGVRGQVSLFLFHHFSSNTVGILAATTGLWMLNLIIPAIVGSLLLLRTRLLH